MGYKGKCGLFRRSLSFENDVGKDKQVYLQDIFWFWVPVFEILDWVNPSGSYQVVIQECWLDWKSSPVTGSGSIFSYWTMVKSSKAHSNSKILWFHYSFSLHIHLEGAFYLSIASHRAATQLVSTTEKMALCKPLLSFGRKCQALGWGFTWLLCCFFPFPYKTLKEWKRSFKVKIQIHYWVKD